MKTVYQVRHSFNYKDDEGKSTFFTRANEHLIEETVDADRLAHHIATGSVVKVEAEDDYRAPGEPLPEGEEPELEGPVFSEGTTEVEEPAAPKRKARKR